MDDPVVVREILVHLGRWQPEALAHRPCRLRPRPRTRASR